MINYTSRLGNKKTSDLIDKVRSSSFGQSRDLFEARNIPFSLGEDIPLEVAIKDKSYFIRRSLKFCEDDIIDRLLITREEVIKTITDPNDLNLILQGELSVREYCARPKVPIKFSALWSIYLVIRGMKHLGYGVLTGDENMILNAANVFGKSLSLLKDSRIRSSAKVDTMTAHYQSIVDCAHNLITHKNKWDGNNRIPDSLYPNPKMN